MPARLYVVGRVWLETPAAVISERHLPARQGRLLLAALAVDRARPVTRAALAERLWPVTLPDAWENALSALVSKLRAVLARAFPRGEAAVLTSSGCHQLRLPPGTWVDLEHAVAALDRAEGALRRGDLATAWSAATVASAIVRRPFLPGEDVPWADEQRRRLHDLLLRALSCLADVWAGRADHVQAACAAREVIALEPYRETAYRRLMVAHAALGDRAEALRVYQQCRELLAADLGATPSDETEELHRRIRARAPG